MSERRQLVRLGMAIAVVLIAFGGLAFRVGRLHLGDNSALRDSLAKTRRVEQQILVGRGRILDRRGSILAMDLTVYRLNADPQMILRDGLVEAYAALFSRKFGMDRALLETRLRQPERRQVYLASEISEDDRQRVLDLKLKHVWLEPVSARNYPQRNLASHVVGFSNAEGVGSAGVEQALDEFLRGVPGMRVSQQDGRRREMLDRRVLEIPAQAGADVHLTIDMNLQAMAEAALDQAVQQHRPLGAWALVQDVRTGEVLAMASRPDFDLNAYGRTPPERMRNAVTGCVYEPGSTFKIGVIAAALNEGIVQPETVFDCENGLWMYRGRPLRDFHPYGRLSLADVLKKSSNIGAAKTALLLGDARLERYLRDFGVGRAAGIELPGEEAGIFRARAHWDTLASTRIAMGHSVSLTTLQMLGILSAIGNHGFLMRPMIVRRVVDAKGRVLHEASPTVVSRPIREDTARLMCALLARVTEEGGTGRRAAIPGYRVAGKTGTAVKPGIGGYDERRNIASFIGVIPADDPTLAIAVVVDEPQPEHTGGVVAAPIFRQIAQEAVRYLNIPPTGTVQPIDPGDGADAAADDEEEAGHADRAAL